MSFSFIAGGHKIISYMGLQDNEPTLVQQRAQPRRVFGFMCKPYPYLLNLIRREHTW